MRFGVTMQVSILGFSLYVRLLQPILPFGWTRCSARGMLTGSLFLKLRFFAPTLISMKHLLTRNDHQLLGIAFAPLTTPHLSERFGRQAIYLFSLPTFCLFILGASFSRSFAALAVCRFFAGFFGGPCLV